MPHSARDFLQRTGGAVDGFGVHDPRPSTDPPAGICDMVHTIWPREPTERRRSLIVATNIQSFLAARRLQSWADLDVGAFVSQHARRPSQRIQLCLDITGMLPWLIRSGELTRDAAIRLWLDLHAHCPDDAHARASIELTIEHFGPVQNTRVA